MTITYNPDNCVVSVGVTDYDRSLEWYREVLGFELVYELKEYGWCELKTPFGFNVGLGQTETVTPGNVTPTSWRAAEGEVTINRARYQIWGRRSLRCMSLASSARPSVVCVPATTQLLLPPSGGSGAVAADETRGAR